MKHHLLLTLLPAALLFTCAGTKPPPSSTVTGNLQRIIDKYCQTADSIAKLHPLRLGVLPFIASGTRAPDSGNEFGRYVAEKLTSRMAGAGERIKVFERSRLDAIFRENSLELSGLVSEADARRIGELVPIDFLFTGTFTMLKHSVSLSGRLIDVASGEIVFASSDECALTEEISELLPKAPEPTGPHAEAAATAGNDKVCADLQASLDEKVNAAKPDDQFSVLIDEGMKIPFDSACPEIHFSIIERCRRGGVNPPKYTGFLIVILKSIKRSDDDNRTDAIFNYFRADKAIDDTEWNAGLDALANIRWVDRYLEKLIIGDTLTPGIEKRLAELASRCKGGGIGKPPVTFDDLLYSVLLRLGMFGRSSMGLRRPTEKESRQARDALHLVQRFENEFSWSIPEKYADLLEDLWYRERYSAFGDSIFTQVCLMVSRTRSEKCASIIEHIARTLVNDIFKRDTATAAFHQNAMRTTQQFAETCRRRIVDATEQLGSRRLANTDIPALCLFTGITAPAIPTPDSISLWLSSENSTLSRRAAEYAVYMDKRAIVFEDKLIRVLRQRVRGEGGSEFDNGRIVRALGATRTAKTEACELLIVCLDSLNYRFPRSEVVRAMARIGRPAVPFIKRYFEKDPASHAYATADFFEQLGPDASGELPYLERKARAITNTKARYYLEDAVERMKRR